MRMWFIRILPDTWARTLWPLSISTRNIALGSGSITLPSTSIASSFLLMAFRFHLSPVPWTGASYGSESDCRRDGARNLAELPQQLVDLVPGTSRSPRQGADEGQAFARSHAVRLWIVQAA